jgi:radical SAM protein with 4Fe4S-binding SPASM domain
MIKEIGLSITDGCNADCVFCPRRDWPSGTPKFMPIEMVRKIVKEVGSDEFKAKHDLCHIVIGENGEPTLHKGLIDILREVKKLDVPVDLFTNFSGMTPKKSKTIVDEKLVKGIHTNVDGATKETYEQIKRLDYDKVIKNINSFISVNDDIHLFVHAVLTENYINAVERTFGKKPRKLVKNPILIPNEERSFLEIWQNLDYVHAHSESCLMWAERKGTVRKPGEYVCHNIARVEINAFINPKGDWYICCFDTGNEMVFGNITKQTFDEIYESETRKEILQLIKDQKFDELGSPCNRVDCCQVIGR